MAIITQKASELAKTPWGVCMAIYGTPGAGKTTLVSEAVYSEFAQPVDFADCEGGARAITHMGDINVHSLTDPRQNGEAFADFERLVEQYISKQRTCGTLIVDNVSELQNLCVRWVVNHISRGQGVGAQDRPDIKDWSTVTARMLMLTRKLRDFARNSGTNVFFIAWEAPERGEGDSVVKRDLAFSPSFARQFPGIIDVVGRLTVVGDSRSLSFAPSATTAAKFRRGGGEAANQIPDTIRFKRGDKPIVDILACLKGGKPWPTNKYLRAQPNSTQINSESKTSATS